MARRCLACLHARVAELNAALRSAERPTIAALALEYAIHRDAVVRHAVHHLAESATAAPVTASAAGRSSSDADVTDVSEECVAESGADQDRGEPGEGAVPQLDRRVRATQRRARGDAKQRFLTAYRASGNVSQAATVAGVGRKTIYNWQELDETFVLAMREAENEAVEALEAEARERAVTGSKLVRRVYRNGKLIEEIHEFRPSDTVLVKLLQALRPEKYGDKLAVTQTQIVKTIDAVAWDSV